MHWTKTYLQCHSWVFQYDLVTLPNQAFYIHSTIKSDDWCTWFGYEHHPTPVSWLYISEPIYGWIFTWAYHCIWLSSCDKYSQVSALSAAKCWITPHFSGSVCDSSHYDLATLTWCTYVFIYDCVSHSTCTGSRFGGGDLWFETVLQ
jgi:hypothetical protein